jgi:hypothetical protein
MCILYDLESNLKYINGIASLFDIILEVHDYIEFLVKCNRLRQYVYL